MSIINEALKKTEEYLQKNATKNNLIAPKHPASKSVLLYILILLAGLLLGNYIFYLLSHKLQSKSLASSSQTLQSSQKNIDTVVPATNTPTTALPLNQPLEKKSAEPSFVLNGIFFSDDDGYALVNNQIVRENDYVDAAKVSLITPNTVELDNAGQKIILTTRR